MSFDWMKARRRQSKVRSLKRVAMYRRDVHIRASMFYRLGYSADHAKRRLAANAAWEFESGRRPDSLSADEISSIVDAAYARRPDHGART